MDTPNTYLKTSTIRFGWGYYKDWTLSVDILIKEK